MRPTTPVAHPSPRSAKKKVIGGAALIGTTALTLSGLGVLNAHANTITINGTQLSAKQAENLRFVATKAYPRLSGSEQERLDKLSVTTWWTLKEGVLGVKAGQQYSNCHFPSGDAYISHTQVCPDGEAWQVGLTAIQVPNFPNYNSNAKHAQKLHPGKTADQIVAATMKDAGVTAADAKTVMANPTLKNSWLLRDPALGTELIHGNIVDECVNGSRSWCYGSGWDTSRQFAATKSDAQRSQADLRKAIAAMVKSGSASSSPAGKSPAGKPAGKAVSASAKPASQNNSATTEKQTAGHPAKVWDLGGWPLNVRQSATTNSARVTHIYEGKRFTIACQKRAESVYNDIHGFSSELWDYSPELGGWVADAWISTGSYEQVAPTCSDGDTPTAVKPAPTKASAPATGAATAKSATKPTVGSTAKTTGRTSSTKPTSTKTTSTNQSQFVTMNQLITISASSNCGPTSASMILVAKGKGDRLKGYNGPNDYTAAIDNFRTNDLGVPHNGEGTDHYALARAMRAYGVDSHMGLAKESLAAVKNGQMVLVFTNMQYLGGGDTGHYVVARGYEDGKVVIADPAGGLTHRVSDSAFIELASHPGQPDRSTIPSHSIIH